MTTTDSVRADEVQLGDSIVLDYTFFTGKPKYEILTITHLRLVGDDVEMGDDACPGKVTTSRGNPVAVLPRSVIARLGE
jgi:hypothetical protein